MENQENRRAPERIQLHLVLPYKFQPREDRRVQSYLERGYRISQLQRMTDREVIVTLTVATSLLEA